MFGYFLEVRKFVRKFVREYQPRCLMGRDSSTQSNRFLLGRMSGLVGTKVAASLREAES